MVTLLYFAKRTGLMRSSVTARSAAWMLCLEAGGIAGTITPSPTTPGKRLNFRASMLLKIASSLRIIDRWILDRY